MQHRPRNLITEQFRRRTRYVITELKENEHKELSVIGKGTSYFNIFECGRNLLDQLDVTYQRAFMASSAQDEYYKEMTKVLIKANIKGGKLCIL